MSKQVFAGAGGYSYLAQRDESCEISCCWAVDTCEAACTTYTINHPEAQARTSLELACLLLILLQACFHAVKIIFILAANERDVFQQKNLVHDCLTAGTSLGLQRAGALHVCGRVPHAGRSF